LNYFEIYEIPSSFMSKQTNSKRWIIISLNKINEDGAK
jgi:hypothetical protein